MEIDPPFSETYKDLLSNHQPPPPPADVHVASATVELPVIDLARLSCHDTSESCKDDIAKASEEWGFFQVVNHGISREILDRMRREQVKVFKQPFDKKNSTIEQFATTVADLAQKLAQILAERVGRKSSFFKENCLASSCYLRMNRYPPCPMPTEVFGLMPHTDSDFLTILHQDQVGGLQLVRDGKWFAVKPNPRALIINIGDLFQAWSNDVYKSVVHRVVTNPQVERFSTAYFFCPSYDTKIESDCEPSVYKKFTFREYRTQVQIDVEKLGYKIGLPHYLIE
ncbi:Gibberellin 2-beta-dioxygenase 8 [Linum perenne]